MGKQDLCSMDTLLIAIASWVSQISELKRQNIDVVLVSSGAIAEGMKRLGWRPLYLIALIILVLTAARSFADNKSILLIAKSRGLSANSWSYFASSRSIVKKFFTFIRH
jgi:hypothetical protein